MLKPQKLHFCAATKNQFVFDPFGKISTCWWGLSFNQFEIGKINFKEHTFIFDEKKLNSFKNRHVNNITNCINCKYKYLCGGGCVYKVLKNGKKNITNPNCSNYYNLFKEYLKFKLL